MKTPPKPIRVSVGDFERLMRLAGDVRIAELEAAMVVERAKRRVAESQRVQQAHVKALARRYRDFRPDGVNYRPDEATRTLVPVVNQEPKTDKD